MPEFESTPTENAEIAQNAKSEQELPALEIVKDALQAGHNWYIPGMLAWRRQPGTKTLARVKSVGLKQDRLYQSKKGIHILLEYPDGHTEQTITDSATDVMEGVEPAYKLVGHSITEPSDFDVLLERDGIRVGDRVKIDGKTLAKVAVIIPGQARVIIVEESGNSGAYDGKRERAYQVAQDRLTVVPR